MARLYQEMTYMPPQAKWLVAGAGFVPSFGLFLFDLLVRHNFNWNMLQLAAMSLLFWFVFRKQENGRGATSLEVDDRGLTYKHMWMVRRWSWSDLSAPEMARGGINFDRYIRLRPAKPIDWFGRLFLPGLASSGLEICIKPIFGARLEEMFEELKACRGGSPPSDEVLAGQASLPA